MTETIHVAPLEEGEKCPVQYGAVCWRMNRGKVEVLLITSRDTGRWVIPKGWPMQQRSPAEAASQEAWEEAGVRGHVADDAVGNFNYTKVMTPQRSVQCAVQVFALRVSELANKFPEKKERRRKWFVADKAARKVQEPELRNLLEVLRDQLHEVIDATAKPQKLAKA